MRGRGELGSNPANPRQGDQAPQALFLHISYLVVGTEPWKEYRKKRWLSARLMLTSVPHTGRSGAKVLPDTKPGRSNRPSLPATCGARVRKSSSSSFSEKKSPIKCGPPSTRTTPTWLTRA